MDENNQQPNLETLAAWDANAGYWDEKMGEGNDFVEVLIRPATERLLAIRPGERVLDIACGNGLAARRLAEMGAEVVAFDFSPEMIARARARPCEAAGHIDYRVLDATDEIALLALGAGQFDAALCNMALFDMANIDPLLRALSRLLRPGGRFVFSIVHPCFNNPYATHLAEMSFELDLPVDLLMLIMLALQDLFGRAVRYSLRQPPQRPLSIQAYWIFKSISSL